MSRGRLNQYFEVHGVIYHIQSSKIDLLLSVQAVNGDET